MTTTWTEPRVETLKTMWHEGYSASQIACELGGVTRNSIIGKVHRLGLSGRTKGAKLQAARHNRPKEHRPLRVASLKPLIAYYKPRPAPPPPIEQLVVPISLHATILSLSDQMCKWPHGDPLHEDFHFCGQKPKSGKPYCEYHFRVAYEPVADRRRERVLIDAAKPVGVAA